MANPVKIDAVLDRGAEIARVSASQLIAKVKKKMLGR